MSFALSAGVTGLQAHQKMLDVAGNNLANVNTTGFKASRVIFSELLSETLQKASQPTDTVGGTNPQQMGSGVGVAGISPDMAQGSFLSTGIALDLAIEGEGYFVLNDGSKDVYTRAGAFAVDENKILVDPATGYKVQRMGEVGQDDGFQLSGVSDISVPYGINMPAKATTSVSVVGNLSANSTFDTTQGNVLTSNIAFTTSSGTAATSATLISALDQYSGTAGGTAATIKVTGYQPDGTEVTDATGLTITPGTTTVGDLLTYIDTKLNGGATDVTASISNGKIVVTDDTAGYSQTDLALAYTASSTGSDALTSPEYFEILTVGGEEVKSINIKVFDSLGNDHVLSGAFVRTGTANQWDMVLTSITGDVNSITNDNRRIKGITFNSTTGVYSGITGSDPSNFIVGFDHDPSNPQTITLSMGTAGQWNGLGQQAGASTAVATSQDGYEAGSLSTVSVNKEGIVIGAFSNGIKKNIAMIQVALFQNTTGLESVGSGYKISSANSGTAVAKQASTGGAGSIRGGSLEKSNADVATEFINMIQAQNGFQANARTIRVANDILRELTSLIR
ncbi:MAG: flagellar hook-basal body complex protein [Planctomycetes bacterium]|nr:flagellar hook-basal body complex protein [Planctomycetota bacterium]